jgi:hypothetical protein
VTVQQPLPIEDEDDQGLFWALQRKLEFTRATTVLLNDYYEGDQALEQLGLAIPPELRDFSVILNWPRVAVDGCEQRLDVVGFRLGTGRPDSYLGQLWQYNDLDEHQSVAHTEALALARSFLCLGTNEDDPDFPLVTVESPLEMATIRDPRTRKVIAALRLFGEQSDQNQTQQTADLNATHSTLYLPDVTYTMSRDQGTWVLDDDPDDHNLGIVCVVPMLNRGRATNRRFAYAEGVSEMNDVIPIAESASRAITNGQLAQETHAVPHRVLLGATKADFVKPDGTPTRAFDAYMSGLTALANPNGKAVQFDATDLSNFANMVDLYAGQAASVANMPPEYFGLHTQNPPSADGQRAGETRLIKKAERKQTSFGHAWEQVARIAMRMRGVDDSLELRQIEAIWRDAGTPTKAQQTDATVKLRQAGLVDWETAQIDLGRTPAEIELMKQRRIDEMRVDNGFGLQAALVEAANAGEPNALTEAGAEQIAGAAAAAATPTPAARPVPTPPPVRAPVPSAS